MDRRQTLKLMGGAAALAGTGFPGFAFAQAQKGNGHGREDRGHSVVQCA